MSRGSSSPWRGNVVTRLAEGQSLGWGWGSHPGGGPEQTKDPSLVEGEQR